jgi:hypothetical protein
MLNSILDDEIFLCLQQTFKCSIVLGFLWVERISEALTDHTLTLLLFNMKTGHTEKHEISLYPSTQKGDKYLAPVSRILYHRLKAHFGTGPFTTSFTMSHGPFIIHGYVKTDQDLQISVKFEKVKKNTARKNNLHQNSGK